MNAKRRKRVEEAVAILEEVKAEEESAYENLPESFQSAEQGEKMQEHIGNLDEAIGSLNEVAE